MLRALIPTLHLPLLRTLPVQSQIKPIPRRPRHIQQRPVIQHVLEDLDDSDAAVGERGLEVAVVEEEGVELVRGVDGVCFVRGGVVDG